MIGRVLLAVILAGLTAGLLMGVIQHVRLTPLILAAETFESGSHAHGADGSAHQTDDHSHGSDSSSLGTSASEHQHTVWSPADGFERTLYTTLTAILTAIGFALLLSGISFLANIPITSANGMIWGLCGFLSFSLAPAIGLPPELPGMPSADITSRTIWWIGCVLTTGMGIYLLHTSIRHVKAIVPAVFFFFFPHGVMSLPRAAETNSNVPAQLATEFATASLGANLAMWVTLGIALGFALKKFEGTFEL